MKEEDEGRRRMEEEKEERREKKRFITFIYSFSALLLSRIQSLDTRQWLVGLV